MPESVQPASAQAERPPGGERPIFTRFPELRSALTAEHFATLPTPVQQLPVAAHAWIKRDDLTHPEYGGNKIRKLEFIIADAKRRGANRIVTFGAVGTNHGVATAMLCQQADLECIVYLFDQPTSATVTQNLKLMQSYGATLLYKGSLKNTVKAYYLSPYRLQRCSYFLFAGGSNVYGTLSFVNAALELHKQIEQAQCPQPAAIICPVGSSATLAGLTCGVQLCELDIRVLGIRVAPEKLGPFPACTPQTVTRLMNEAFRYIKRHTSEALPSPQQPLLIGDYYGEGYGVATDKGVAAVQTFAAAGIQIEQTYTAKAAAAFIDELQRSSEATLFWNTFNSQDMTQRANAANSADLPAVLQAYT